MNELLIQRLMIGLLLIFFTANISWAEEIVTGVDKESGNDKVLLHGKFLGSKGRIIYLDDVTPLCRGKRSFRVRHKGQKVHLKKGIEVWFWLIGDCGSNDDVIDDDIDMIAKP